jgi:hypothetical protein
MPEPADPADGAPRATVQKWEKKIDEFVKRELALEEKLRTLYTLVWGQCTKIVRARVEALPNCKDMSKEFDALALLKAIKSITYNLQSQKYKPNALIAASADYMSWYRAHLSHAKCTLTGSRTASTSSNTAEDPLGTSRK